jgi:hypothetical protein
MEVSEGVELFCALLMRVTDAVRSITPISSEWCSSVKHPLAERKDVAEGEQAAEGDQHRGGMHSLPIKNYMVYIQTIQRRRNRTFARARTSGKSPEKKTSILYFSLE